MFRPGMLCAGGNKKGTCFVRRYKFSDFSHPHHFQGDSGGALTVDGVLAGIVSGGSMMCAKVQVDIED